MMPENEKEQKRKDWTQQRRRAIPLNGKKYLIVPGPMQDKESGETNVVTAESLIHLYGVEPAECYVYVDGKDRFRELPPKMLVLIPRYEREDYVAEDCFTVEGMIASGAIKEAH